MTDILTIGVYGFTPETFAACLKGAGADALWDIRARRGVRGSQYAFANKTRLIQLLKEIGIAYVHAPTLAPPADVRALQHAADRATSTGKRSRRALSPEFERAYTEACLAGWEPLKAVQEYSPQARKIALLCVEKEAAACHRSIVAQKLASALQTSVRHLEPT